MLSSPRVMLEPSVFSDRWNTEVVASHPDVEDFRLHQAPSSIATAPILASTADFLTQAGLPDGCAPFLSFRAVAAGAVPLPEYYGLPSTGHLTQFRVIGSDGAGNPLCIDTTADDIVVRLDHEDRFATTQFVASSVSSLAEALLLLHTVPREAFLPALRQCDSRAAHPDAFLPREFAMLNDA